MAIQNIHKQAILKLINTFTTTKSRWSFKRENDLCDQLQPEENGGDQTSSYLSSTASNLPSIFKDTQTIIDLSAMPRLGYIISKFEQYFRPNSLIINGNVPAVIASNNQQKNLMNNQQMNQNHLIYLQQIQMLIEYIENNDLLRLKFETNGLEETLHLQSSQHVQMLILLIRDWMLQFYLNKNFMHELFPSTTSNEGTTFSLVDIKENNIFFISLLIFNIFYKVRTSFCEYNLVLDFSWICFNDLEPYINLAELDTEYIYSMLQSSLLSARIEEEQEQQMNANLYKQIELLNQKLAETKRRMISLDVTKQQISTTNNKKIQEPLTNKMKMIDNNNNKQFVPNSSSYRLQISTIASRQGFPASSSSTSATQKSSNEIKRFDRPYKCEICLKTFPTSYKLNRHSYSHSGERPYMCTWENCDKRFNDNYHLRRHMNTHTGEKPYSCKFPGCPKRYSRSEDLRNHQKTHYNANNQQQPTPNATLTATATSVSSNVVPQQTQQQNIVVNLTQPHNRQTHQMTNIQQPTASNNNNNQQQPAMVQLVQQRAQTPITTKATVVETAATAAKSPATASSGQQQIPNHNHHHHQQSQQQHAHQQMLQTQLNQLQQQIQQQNYVAQEANATTVATISSSAMSQPNNNNRQLQPQTSNPSRQNPNGTLQQQQHLTENYY